MECQRRRKGRTEDWHAGAHRCDQNPRGSSVSTLSFVIPQGVLNACRAAAPRGEAPPAMGRRLPAMPPGTKSGIRGRGSPEIDSAVQVHWFASLEDAQQKIDALMKPITTLSSQKGMRVAALKTCS